MSKIADRLPPEWSAIARRCTTRLDLSIPPPGRRGGRLRRVLSLGTPEGAVEALRRFPFSLTEAVDISDFVLHLATRSFDAVIVLPDDPGIHAVRVVKLGDDDPEVEWALCVRAVERSRLTPFFLLPLPGELMFALVVAPPSLVFFYDSFEVALDQAILNVDVGAILRTAPS